MTTRLGSSLGKVTVRYDIDPTEILNDQSKPVRVSNRDDPVRLCLFQTVPVVVARTAFGPWVLDCVLYTGGLCWTLDWCPAKAASDVEYLTISCHPKYSSSNTIGSLQSGTGLIQIWSICKKQEQSSAPMDMKIGIVHNGAVCWSLQWCPDPQGLFCCIDENSLGILAASLGNGEVHIVSVPRPKEDQRTGPEYLEIKPVYLISPTELCGSIVSCIDWLPMPPYDLLLLGCWDGSISIWGLPCSSFNRTVPQHLMKHQIDYLALRGAAWLRPPPGEAIDVDLFRNSFCTAGHTGRFMIWNCHNIFQPVFERSLTRTWLLDLAVSGNPMTVYIAVEDASVRQLPLEVSCYIHQNDRALFQNYTGSTIGSVMSVSCSLCNRLTAYGGEDGEIVICPRENTVDSRYRKPHICAGAIKYNSQTDEIRMYTASEMSKIGGVRIGESMITPTNTEASNETHVPLSEVEIQTIQCVKFSPNGDGSTWLAAGSVSGVIRLIRITE